MKPYICRTKKYIASQILWDLFGVICLAAAPLLQEWLFDHGPESSWKEILAVIAGYFLLLVMYAVSQFFCALFSFKGGIQFENLLKKDFFRNVFHMESSRFYEKSIGEYIRWEFNLPSDIASGRIAEACKGMISAKPMHASQQECWSILELSAGQ